MKHVIQEIGHRTNNIRNELIASIFLKYRQASWTSETPFQSLLFQLWLQVPDLMFDRLSLLKHQRLTMRKPGKDMQWNVLDLQEHLQILLIRASQNHKIWLFIDALDECEEYQRAALMKFLRSFLELHRSDFLQICCSTRTYTCDVTPVNKNDLHIILDDENQRDISKVIRAELKDKSLPKGYKGAITALLLEKASGTFVWAKLALAHMRKSLGKGERIEPTLHTLPTDLDSAYRTTLDRINEGGQATRAQVLKLFQWVLYTHRPLSTNELNDALQPDLFFLPPPPPHRRTYSDIVVLTDYVDISWGLLERVPRIKEIDMVQFVHQTARDYILHSGLEILDPTLKLVHNTAASAHYDIARKLIDYFSMDKIIDFARYSPHDLVLKFPLLRYAASYWLVHVQVADLEDVAPEIRLHCLRGLSSRSITRWKELNQVLSAKAPRFKTDALTFPHVASRYGLHNLLLVALNEIPELGAKPDQDDDTGRTPLSWAAGSGHKAVVRLLLSRGASVGSRDRLYGLPILSWAALGGEESIVQQILNAGADINDDKSGCPALCFAVLRGNQAVVRLLLENGANPDAIDRHRGQSALSLAAARGHSSAVVHLLTYGANPSLPDLHSRITPLQHAIQNSKVDIVEILLEHGADITDLNYEVPSTWVGRVFNAVLGTVKLQNRRAKTACTGNQKASTTSSSYCLLNSTGSKGSADLSGKRSWGQGGSTGGAGDDNGDHPKKRQLLDPAPNPQEDNIGLRFACPYFKHAPQLYMHKENCSGRSSKGWYTVSRIKLGCAISSSS